MYYLVYQQARSMNVSDIYMITRSSQKLSFNHSLNRLTADVFFNNFTKKMKTRRDDAKGGGGVLIIMHDRSRMRGGRAHMFLSWSFDH